MSNFYQIFYKWKIILVFSLIWINIFTIKVFAQKIDPNIQKKAQLISVKCNFTFVVFETGEASTIDDVKYLDISTFLEAKYFTTAQLKKYFTCWSREFPKIGNLRVTASSDKSVLEVHYPIKSDPPDRSKEIYKTPPNGYEADYTRSAEDGKESFVYNPDPKSWKRITYKFKKHTVPLKRKRGR